MGKKIVIGQRTDPNIVEYLRHSGDVTVVTGNDANELLAACRGAVCLQIGTWAKITAEFMDAAGTLKVVSRTGVGVDSVDVDAATKRGILVLNTPQANAQSVAEHALSQLLALSKRIVYMDANVRAGNFQARREYKSVELQGKTLGVLGYGNIGRRMAQMAHAALGMPVLAYDPFITKAPDYVTLCASIDEVLTGCDALSVHLPLLPDTRNLLNAEKLALLKPAAYLICTSRGGIVDEDALAAALIGNRLAGAALDVFEPEPPKLEKPLFSAPNLIVSPHCAGLTKESVERVAMTAAEGIADYLAGKQPAFIVNRRGLGL